MQTSADWSEIVLRLLLSAIDRAAIGINRGEADHPVDLVRELAQDPAIAALAWVPLKNQ